MALEVLKTVLGKGGNFVTSTASGTSSGTGSGSGTGSNANGSSNANGGNGGGKDGEDAAVRVGVSVMAVAGVVATFITML